MEEKSFTVNLESIRDYEFRVQFGGDIAELMVDEPEPLGTGAGPNASRLLSAAVGNCLSASLLFCLRRGRIEPQHIQTAVTTAMSRTEQGRWRVKSSQVVITVTLDLEIRERTNRCLELFEDYCVVTQSVREGIDVQVTVQDQEGNVLHQSG